MGTRNGIGIFDEVWAAIGDRTEFVAFTTGWDSDYSNPSSGKYPERIAFNDLFGKLTAMGVDLNKYGILPWDSSIEYQIGAYVVEGSTLYRALTITQGHTPSVTPAVWELVDAVALDGASSAQGALADTAVQPADLGDYMAKADFAAYGPDTVVVCPFDPTITAIANGVILAVKAAEARALALAISSNAEEPATSTIVSDYLRPTLLIESGYYDLDGTPLDCGTRSAADDSSFFNMIAMSGGVPQGEEALALTDIPENDVYIKGDLDMNNGLGGVNLLVKGITLEGSVIYDGDGCTFVNCWVQGNVTSPAGAAEYSWNMIGTRVDGQLVQDGVLTNCYVDNCFFEGIDFLGDGGYGGVGRVIQIKNSRFPGAGFIAFSGVAGVQVYVENCKINSDRALNAPNFSWPTDLEYHFKNCEFYGGLAAAWFPTNTTAPAANTFVNCEGIDEVSQAVDAAKILWCTDAAGAVVVNKV